MIKSVTDIEQSKRLAEILPIESADYTWENEWINGDVLGIPENDRYSFCRLPFDNFSGDGLPCWGLAALLEVIPYPNLIQDIRKKWSCIAGDDSNSMWNIIGRSRYVDNPIDACVELIVELHKEGLL